jgi:hypothetical protein
LCFSLSSAAFFFDSILAVVRAAHCRPGWGVLSFVTSFYGNSGPKFPHKVPAEQVVAIFGVSRHEQGESNLTGGVAAAVLQRKAITERAVAVQHHGLSLVVAKQTADFSNIGNVERLGRARLLAYIHCTGNVGGGVRKQASIFRISCLRIGSFPQIISG